MYIKNLIAYDKETLTFETNYLSFQSYPYQLPNHKEFPVFLITGLLICSLFIGFFVFIWIAIQTQGVILSITVFLLIMSLPILIGQKLLKRPIIMTLKYFKNQNLLVYLSDNTPLCSLHNPQTARLIIRMFYIVGRNKQIGVHYKLFPTLCLEVVGENADGQLEFLRILENSSYGMIGLRKNFETLLNELKPILDFLNLPLMLDKDNIYWEHSEKTRHWSVYDMSQVKDLNEIKPKD